MRALTPRLSDHIRSQVTTLAFCWRIERRDGLVQGFTSVDKDLIIEGLTYKAATGIRPTAIAMDNTLSVNNLSIDSILSDEGIKESDLIGGKYDYAKIFYFAVNYEDLPDLLTLTPPQLIRLVDGVLGEMQNNGRSYTIEVRSLTQTLEQGYSALTSKDCRYKFGDSRCTKNLAPLTYNLSVISTVNTRSFAVSPTFLGADRIFNFGELTWTSGENVGTISAIATYTASTKIIVLFEEPAYPIAVGNTFSAVAGCQRTARACEEYGNSINFGGEPYIPGADEFLAGAR